jgi:hypothetical protein
MAIDYSDWAASEEEAAGFDTPPFDYEAGRQKLLSRITRTMKQLNNEKVSPQGGKDFQSLHNNGVFYKPTLNGHPVQLPGLPPEGVKIDRNVLQERLKVFAKDVEDKHFDEQIKTILSLSTSGGTKAASKRAPKASGEKPWQSRKDWSSLSFVDKQTINANYRHGMNPDRSAIDEVGHKPDAPIVGNPKKKKGS